MHIVVTVSQLLRYWFWIVTIQQRTAKVWKRNNKRIGLPVTEEIT